jgi:hypothetical protein
MFYQLSAVVQAAQAIEKLARSAVLEPTVHKPLHILRVPTVAIPYTVVHFILCMDIITL